MRGGTQLCRCRGNFCSYQWQLIGVRDWEGDTERELNLVLPAGESSGPRTLQGQRPGGPWKQDHRSFHKDWLSQTGQQLKAPFPTESGIESDNCAPRLPQDLLCKYMHNHWVNEWGSILALVIARWEGLVPSVKLRRGTCISLAQAEKVPWGNKEIELKLQK